MKFSDIPQFPHSSYSVDVAWEYLEKHLADELFPPEGMASLDLEPDFQRAHVWTEQQQIAYVEYILRGGTTGKDIYFNHTGWHTDFRGSYVIVDGKQRLRAVRRFIGNEIPIFGTYFQDFEDHIRVHHGRFHWHIASLQTREEVLKWYLDFNSAGTAHTPEEIERVRALLAQTNNE